jgi:hypothetical protein
VRVGTPITGKPRTKKGVRSAAPEIPLNMAVVATTMQTGSMNQ